MSALSPLTESDMAAVRDGRIQPWIETGTGPAVDTRYRCPECLKLQLSRGQAETCCPRDIVEVPVDAKGGPVVDAEPPDNFAAACPVCNCVKPDAYEAADCCLWRDLAMPKRFRVAQAVEAGAEWADAIAEATK